MQIEHLKVRSIIPHSLDDRNKHNPDKSIHYTLEFHKTQKAIISCLYYVHNVIYIYVHNFFKQVYVHSYSMQVVKLKKLLSRRDKDLKREYFRYDITIPNKDIDTLGWKNVKNLKSEVKGKKLIIEKE